MKKLVCLITVALVLLSAVCGCAGTPSPDLAPGSSQTASSDLTAASAASASSEDPSTDKAMPSQAGASGSEEIKPNLDEFGDKVVSAIIDAIGLKRYQMIRDGIDKPTQEEAQAIEACIEKYAQKPEDGDPGYPEDQEDPAGKDGPAQDENTANETDYGTIVISLPFFEADKPREMMPMGETINHPDPPNPGGHPGIDFMWDNSVDIIACVNGTVLSMTKGGNHDKWDVFIKTGNFKIGYTTLEKVDDKIKVGSQVAAGQKIGEPGNFGHYMIHWELDSVKTGRRICPMAYFDDASRQRILDIWADTAWPEMKGPFPHICNYVYRCDYCKANGY